MSAQFTVESPIGPLQGYAYKTPFDPVYHIAFVYGGIGKGTNVLTRFHKANIMQDVFQPSRSIALALERFKAAGSGVLIYLRDGSAGVPLTPLEQPTSTDAMRNERWREVGVGAQILRDLGVSSIRNLSSSKPVVPGTFRFRHRDRWHGNAGMRGWTAEPFFDPAVDQQHMSRSPRSWRRANLGRTWPNPSVGAIVVRDGVVVGRGVTQPAAAGPMRKPLPWLKPASRRLGANALRDTGALFAPLGAWWNALSRTRHCSRASAALFRHWMIPIPIYPVSATRCSGVLASR